MRLSPWQGVRWWVGLFVLTLSLGVLGCGTRLGTISGKVSYKTTVLKGGTVTFLTVDKKVSQMAPIGEDGSYTIDKMPLGPVKIAVETKSLKQQASLPQYAPPKDMTGSQPAGADPKQAAKRYVPIPDIFSDSETSGLEVTIQGGNQTHDIKIP